MRKPASPKAVILFAHGSREAGWPRPLERLRARTARALPGATVRLAYLDFLEPRLEAAVARLYARGVRHMRVVPVFVAPGGHLRRDLPGILRALAARHPGLRIGATPATGEAVPVIEATARWIAARGRARRYQ